MTAKNLLTNREYNVNEAQGLLYLEIEGMYVILQKIMITPKEIEYGHLYSHYEINNDIYEGFYTTDYKAFVKEQEQLRLF